MSSFLQCSFCSYNYLLPQENVTILKGDIVWKNSGEGKYEVLCIHFAPVYLKQNKTKKEKNLIVKFFFFCYKEAIVYMLWLVMKKWG